MDKRYSRRGLISVMGMASLAGWGIGIFAVLQGFQSSHKPQGSLISRLPNWDEAGDPKIGSQMSAFKDLPAPIRSHEGDRIIVVALGSCGSCVDEKFKASVANRHGLKFLKLFEAEPGEPSHQLDTPAEGSELASFALTQSSYKTLQAAWLPRFYLCDARGALLAKQSPGESERAFFERSMK